MSAPVVRVLITAGWLLCLLNTLACVFSILNEAYLQAALSAGISAYMFHSLMQIHRKGK